MPVPADARQLELFPEEAPRLLVERASPRARLPPAPSAEKLQLDLFADATLLRTAIDRAIGEADFVEARRLRDALVDEQPQAALQDDLDVLDVLGSLAWEEPDLDAALEALTRARARTRTAGRRRQVADALLLRLSRSFSPVEIASRDEELVPELANALWRAGHDGLSRSLVRDALLGGRDLPPRAFEDAQVRAILAESFVPQRLACLGALRRAWAVPRAQEHDVAVVVHSLSQPPPVEEEDRALAFWACLRVAELRRAAGEALLHEVRKRMKLLDGELHALYMGRVL
jgi:hypothetical protein